MSRGIVDFLQLAVTVAFAVPVAMFGLQLLAGGDTVMGAALLCIAVGMVAIEELLVSPADVPLSVVQKVAGVVAKEPDEE